VDSGSIERVDSSASAPAHRSRSIALAARLGAWGFVAALIPPFAQALNGPRWLADLAMLSALGLLASGVGIVAASVLVIRALPSGVSALKAAAVVGIPFGGALCLGGIAILAPLSRFADVVDASGPLVLLLGVLVVVTLLIGFLRGRNE